MRRIDSTSHPEESQPIKGLFARRKENLYPDSDGQPMSDNTEQFNWIVSIKLNLESLFADRDDVFVAGDLLWYAVEGEPKTRLAPDAMVAFGRPKGYRGSYQQWREGNVPPQVVFEVLSPGNTLTEMAGKLAFYDRHGVEEYYLVDPDRPDLSGWVRREGGLEPVAAMNGWVSPRLGIRFANDESGIRIFHPDGRAFEDFVDVRRERDLAVQRAEEVARQVVEAERRAEEVARLAEEERAARERLAAKLRELGVDPDAL